MNGAIDPAAAEQRSVGCIDDRIDRQPRDIAEFDADAVGDSSTHCCHFAPRREHSGSLSRSALSRSRPDEKPLSARVNSPFLG